ncbi:MAG: hypothetical protein KKB37_04085, partial [Alphaproteobacteria bacterium]|nr:hypothetical protein [Alphaproteobacteria bacterium]
MVKRRRSTAATFTCTAITTATSCGLRRWTAPLLRGPATTFVAATGRALATIGPGGLTALVVTAVAFTLTATIPLACLFAASTTTLTVSVAICPATLTVAISVTVRAAAVPVAVSVTVRAA